MFPRKSIRKKDYDYRSIGYYFITICTHFKQHMLAKISNNQSDLTRYGMIVEACWHNIPKYFPTVIIDAFIVMPNHLHGIIQLSEDGVIGLGTIIQNFKSIAARRINNVRRTPGEYVWQQNYYERIIRTDKALNLIRLYIQLNPSLWQQHKELTELDLTEEKISQLLEKFDTA